MGFWNMTVTGVGAHHNQGYERDANRLFEKFVRDLVDAGHQIQHASFTYGSRENPPINGSPYETTLLSRADETVATNG